MESKINAVAAMRISQMLGPQTLQIFLALEEHVINKGAESFFHQIGFMNPGDPMEEGDLVPTVHLSLQPFQPILSEPVSLEPMEEGD